MILATILLLATTTLAGNADLFAPVRAYLEKHPPSAAGAADLKSLLERQDFTAARPMAEALLARTDPTPGERELIYLWLLQRDDPAEIDRRSRAGHEAVDLLAAGGLAYNMLMFDRADSCYGAALALASKENGHPEWRAAALKGQGLVLYRRRDYDGALARQSEALSERPSPDILLALGETLIRLGRTDEAISAAEWAVRLNPYHEMGHYYLGNGYARRNYTELYNAYPGAFADGATRVQLVAADSLLFHGQRAAARSAYLDIQTAHPGYAEPYIRRASLAFEDGDYTGARDLCFAALRICPEFGRAHAVLAKALEFQRFEIDVHRADYEARFAATPMPEVPGIERYVINWAALSPRDQKRVALSVAPWKTYLPVLLEGGSTHFIKPLYMLLSETPNMTSLRDQRINYDSRLWDDVRGSGGYNTVTGIEDVQRTIFDRYNTVLHELTHQVHGVMTADQSREIQEHYRRAKERDDVTKNGFLSRYAGGSVWEYFAEGANALESPKRDAWDPREVVRERLAALDPDLMALVQRSFARTDVKASYPIAYVNAGNDQLEKGQVDAALVFIEKALQRAPGEETALTAHIEALSLKGDRIRAADEAEQALGLYRESGVVRTTAASALWHAGQGLASATALLVAGRRSIRPEDRWMVDQAIGGNYWTLGDADRSLAAWDSVLAYQSDNPEGLWGRAATLALAQRWDESFAEYDRAVRLRTGVVELRCDYARDLLRAGRLDAAQSQLDAAKLLEPENPPAEALRGWLALLRGDTAAALRHADQAEVWGSWCDLALIVRAKALKATDIGAAKKTLEPLLQRIERSTPPEYTYLPGRSTWISIHELPAVERMLIGEVVNLNH